MDSTQKENEEEKKETETKETQKEENFPLKNKPPQKVTLFSKIDNILYPTTKNGLINLNIKLESVFKTINKFQTSKPILLIKYPETKITCDELKDLFIETEEFPLKEPIKYNIIIDCQNFIHYEKIEKEISQLKEPKKIDINLLNNLLNSINEKGTLMLLCDVYFLRQMLSSLLEIENKKTKFFIKEYIVEKVPFLSLFCLQKMGESKDEINLKDQKLITYELYEDLKLTSPISFTMSQLKNSVTYMSEMYIFQFFLRELHPGEYFPMKIQENFWTNNIEFTITIADSNEKNLLETRKCVAIIVSKNYVSDFMYLSTQNYMALCRQVKAARIILIRPAPFNFDDTNTIKNKMRAYILLFRFRDCIDESIPVMLMSDENQKTEFVFAGNNFVIRDIVDNERKDTFRQLIFKARPNEVQTEIKLILSSLNKIKKDENEFNYIPLHSVERLSKKGFVQCFDDSSIPVFYVKVVLCALYFSNMSNFPKENLKILILGSSCGMLSYFFDKILKSHIEIDNVESDKEIVDIGNKYFGLNNYKKEKKNIKWFFNDSKTFLMECKNENYYDLIINNIININIKEDISPPKKFFEDNVLVKIYSLLKPNGMYINNTMTRNLQNYAEAFNILDKVFPLIYLIDNNEDLNKIHFCFKSKSLSEDYEKVYKDNLSKLNNKEYCDNTLIDNIHRRIMPKVADTELVKKVLFDNHLRESPK